MAIYTLSLDYIDGVGKNQSHLHDAYLKFSNPNCDCKAAIDKSKRLLERYSEAAKKNVDIHTWLDWMSRTMDTSFEIINVDIPAITSEEEMYLMIAAATRPDKKIIVGTHQYWQTFQYANGCNKILYDNKEIVILDKDEAYKEISTSGIVAQLSNLNNMKKNNPWISGSFYLFAMVIIFALLLTAIKILSPIAVPIAIIGGIIAFSVVGAFQLRNDERLSQKSFLQLMALSFKYISFIRSNPSKKNNTNQPDA